MKLYTSKSTVAVFLMLLACSGAISFTRGGFGDSTRAPIKQGTFTYLSTFSGCEVTGCHSGNDVNDPSGLLQLVTDIPSSGWTEGETYQLTVKLAHPGKDVFGFKITSWGDADSASIGSFSTTDTLLQVTSSGIFDFTQTQVGQLQYVTHTSNPGSVTSPEIGEKRWTFNWTAPDVKDQNISFFIAGNAANGNGQITGDYVYYKTVTIGGNGGPMTSLDVAEPFGQVALYPNPVKDVLTINAPNHNNHLQVRIYSINGQLKYSAAMGKNSNLQASMQDYAAGLYFVSITQDNGATKQFKVVKD